MNESESNRQEDHPMPDEYQYDRYDEAARRIMSRARKLRKERDL